jgi:hypothetical protein
VALLVAAIGCASAAPPVVTDTPASTSSQSDGIDEQVVGDGLQFFVHDVSPVPEEGETAEIRGRLTVADGCILLAGEGVRYPMVWPVGTSVAATEPRYLVLPDGQRLTEGQRVLGGGGYYSAGVLGLDLPEQCTNKWDEVARFNPGDAPTVVDD